MVETTIDGDEFEKKLAQEACKEVKIAAKRALLTQSDLVLDLGCGDGRHSMAFRDYGIRSVGLDLEPDHVNLLISLVKGDWNNLPFSDNTFTIATMIYSGLDWDSPLSVLDEVVRVLKPGGYFMFTKVNTEKVIKKYEENGEQEGTRLMMTEKEDILNGSITHVSTLDLTTLEQTIYETQDFPDLPYPVHYQYNSRLIRLSAIKEKLQTSGLALTDSWEVFNSSETIINPHDVSFYLAKNSLKFKH